jgi:hypothetical protein
MSKNSKRIPPALEHGIYSGLGVLPTESRAKFRSFKKQRFADLNISGPLEEDMGDQIVRVEWRLKNLFTYDLAKRAREWKSSIYSKWVPEPWDIAPLPLLMAEQETRSPEEIAALRKRAEREIRIKLGSAIELLQVGDITYESLEKELAIREKLEVMLTRLYKKLAYVRAIKSMAPAALPAPSQPLLEKAA